MSQNPITGREESVGSDSSIGPRATESKVRYEYNYGRDGGAVSTFLLKGQILPDNAVVKDAYIDVITVPVGSGASIALGFESTTDINAADAISGAPWSGTGLVDADGVDIGSESGYPKTTRERGLQMTIAAAVLTAGHFFVTVEYDVTG